MVASPPALRIVFMGTPAFAVPTLDALLASRHSVVAAITQPDRPRGRGQKTADGPVKARARRAGVPVLQPPSLKAADVLAQLTALNADLAVVAAYGKILSNAVLAMPRLGTINVHASLLPKYRGAAPIHRAVAAGEPEPASRSCGSCWRSMPARCSRPCGARLAATKPVPMSSGGSQSSARPLSSRPSTVWRLGRGRSLTGRQPRDLRASADEGRRHHRLVAARATGARPDSRDAAMAECLYLSVKDDG